MHDKEKTDREEFERELDMETTFSFPQHLTEHNILGKHLIIAAEKANWLVCDDEEYIAFGFFQNGKSIKEVEELLIGRHKIGADKARDVVFRLIAQILGKEFIQGAAVIEKEAFKTASLFLTSGCNLRCSTCYLKATVAGPNECSYEDWRKFLQTFASVGGEEVVITGGEPTTNPDCGKIVVCAKDFGLEVILVTNGTLISVENFEVFGKNCDEVRISIDGPNAETHDSVRGKGTFEKTIKGLKMLSTYRDCRLAIAMTPTPATMPVFRTELHNFVQWVYQNIREDVNFSLTQKLKGGRELPGMSGREEKIFMKDIHDLCAQQIEPGFMHKVDAACIIPNRRSFGCGMGETFKIGPNGNIRICIYSSASFGSIKDIGEDDAFIMGVMGKIKGLFMPARVEKNLMCRQCDLRYFCGGKCRWENEQDFGNPNVCECDAEEKRVWYERLVHISPYIVQLVDNP